MVSSLSGTTDGSFTLTLEDGSTRTVNFTGTLDTAVINTAMVKIEFTASQYTAGTKTLAVTASKIELKHEIAVEEGDRVEVEGIISSFAAGNPATFTVNGINVSAGAALTAALIIADGKEISVKGSMEAGVLVASKLELKEAADIERQGAITSANPLAGTFVLGGETVYVNETTIFKDDTDTPAALFGLDDLAAGDNVEVKAYTDDAGHVVAVKLERHNPESGGS